MSDSGQGRLAGPGLRGNREWRLLWLGQAASITGDYFLDITLVLWVATVIARGASWAPIAVGGLLAAAAGPALLLGPVAGVYADRWNRRRTMLVADAARALLIVGLLPLAWPSVAARIPRAGEVAIIYLAVAAASAFAQFFNPSRFALLGTVVPEQDRARASGMFQATASISAIIGPVLAAPVLFGFGVQWALVIDALSFAASFCTISAMRVRDHRTEPGPAGAQPTGFWADFRSGLRFFWSNRVLITVGIGAVVATLGIGAIATLDVFFVVHNLHAPAKSLGFLNGAEGVGAVIGAVLAGRLASRYAAERVFPVALICGGLVFVVYSRLSAVAPAAFVLACGGVVASVIGVVIGPLLLRETPPELTGRVYAVVNVLQQTAILVSMAAAGYLAGTVLRGFHRVALGQTFGPYDTIFGIAGALLIAAGAFSVSRLRRAGPGMVPDGEPAERPVAAGQ